MLSKMVKSLQRVAENVLHHTSYIVHAQYRGQIFTESSRECLTLYVLHCTKMLNIKEKSLQRVAENVLHRTSYIVHAQYNGKIFTVSSRECPPLLFRPC